MASLLGAISSPFVQDKIISFLRNKLIENFIVSVLKLSGFKYWIVGLLADKIIEKGDEKLIEPLFQEIGFEADVLDGATIFRRVDEAENRDEWLDSVNDV